MVVCTHTRVTRAPDWYARYTYGTSLVRYHGWYCWLTAQVTLDVAYIVYDMLIYLGTRVPGTRIPTAVGTRVPRRYCSRYNCTKFSTRGRPVDTVYTQIYCILVQ